MVQPTAGVVKTNAIESLGDVQILPSAVVDPMPPAVSPHHRCLPAGRRGRSALPSGADLFRASIALPSNGGVRSYGPLIYSHA